MITGKATWRSRRDEKMTYFSGGNSSRGTICGCAAEQSHNSCFHKTGAKINMCNCDANDDIARSDSGFITNKVINKVTKAFSKALFFFAGKLGRRCNCDLVKKPFSSGFCESKEMCIMILIFSDGFANYGFDLRLQQKVAKPKIIRRYWPSDLFRNS